MDKKRSIINVTVAIVFKIVLLILTLVVRRFLINYFGEGTNGINSLYLSIISFLSIADLGISTAINFCMYKPITQGDTKKVAALYNLYKKTYCVIGFIILVAGLLIMPIIPFLVKDYTPNFNLYLTFLIMLVSVVLGYFYSAKTSLINAYKNNYVTTTISGIGDIIRYALQIVVLICFQSFELYLVARIVSVLFQWILTEIYTRKHYQSIIFTKERIDNETKQAVIKNTKAMFMHKIGGLLVNTADSIIISAFIGAEILGKYSNYTTIITAMVGILGLFFSPLTSIIGQMCASSDIREQKKHFYFMYLFNFMIGTIFFLGYYAVIDNVIALVFRESSVLSKEVSFIITLNYFIQFMRQTTLLFRDATGTFYYDRFKPIIEGIVNIILSIAFVYWIGVVGVIVATIITNVLICHVIEPLALYKHAYHEKPTKYYLINYSLIAVFTVALVLLNFCLQDISNQFNQLLVNGFIAVGIALVICSVVLVCSRSTRALLKKLFSHFKKQNMSEPVNN